MKTPVALLGCALLAALVVIPAHAQLATRKVMTLAAAKQIAQAAEAEAKKNNWTVVICVVDDGANLVYLQKADQTQIGSIDIAQMKARSAIKLKRSTKVLDESVAGGRTQTLKLPDILPVEGGLPLIKDGQFIGAIGVSGATAAQDGIVAAAGAKALEAID